MRLKISKSPNAASLYVIKSFRKNGVNTSKIVEKLGTEQELREKLGGRDPYEWAKEYVAELTRLEQQEREPEVIKKFSPTAQIDKGKQTSFNGGYLFLQHIYRRLAIDKVCKKISSRHKFEFDLDALLSRLVYGRIIFPSSKRATCELSKRFIEQSNFDLHQIYRALKIIAQECDFIQSTLYNNSLKVADRNTNVLYYDCTNYFFEIEEESGYRQYGISKEHRPNPIVQMGLFMDGDGIPLTFSISSGNTNEQVTLKPLEKKIIDDFNMAKFIVCTDAGLASTANRKFNDRGSRAFVTTQSIKKLKKHLQDWALDHQGWRISGNSKDIYDISKLTCLGDDAKEKYEHLLNTTFYKERWINENGLEQKFIVTFSLKYQIYQRSIRSRHVERANNAIAKNPDRIGMVRQNDYKRFIAKTHCTKEGEIAKKTVYTIDNAAIAKEEWFDGFYGVCTNLNDDVAEIIKINNGRWEIEECFRILKTEFKARLVYVSKDESIEAHFTTCFLALVIFRYLEKQLKEKYTCSEIIQGLRDMNFYEIAGDGYVPTYTRTDFTDDLHDAFGFRTDYQIVTKKQMKNILKATK